jgi:DNA-3-methyladenine glycosylase I
MKRCEWAGGSEAEIEYHDTEWGVPSRDDRHLFEMLILEGAQAGLSWTTILRKRVSYTQAYAGFDPEAVSGLRRQTRLDSWPTRVLFETG